MTFRLSEWVSGCEWKYERASANVSEYVWVQMQVSKYKWEWVDLSVEVSEYKMYKNKYK